MKDEIKEFIEFRTDEDGTYFYYNDKDNIEQWSYKLDDLKDYITNLQKTNKNLKGCIEDTNINYKNIITNLEEELKSANESISWWQNRFNAVEKENKKLKDYYNDNVNNYEELLEKYSTIQILYNSSKSNIDETVKYLKIQIDDYKEELQKTEDEDVKLFCIHKIDTYNELLNILQGGDK